jgi:hypothetical protein
MKGYQTNRTEQLESERTLQLLCVIAQALHRIELRLDKIAAPQPQANKIIAFGGRQ